MFYQQSQETTSSVLLQIIFGFFSFISNLWIKHEEKEAGETKKSRKYFQIIILHHVFKGRGSFVFFQGFFF